MRAGLLRANHFNFTLLRVKAAHACSLPAMASLQTLGPIMISSFAVTRLGQELGLPWWAVVPLQLITALVVMQVFGPKAADLTGKKVPVKEALAGVTMAQGKAPSGAKPIVVEQWATWCPPCVKSIPHINALYKKHGATIDFVGVSNETLTTVAPFIAKMGADMTYPVALDSQGAVQKTFAAAGIPAAWIMNGEGLCIWQGHPANLEAGLRLLQKADKKED